MLGFALLDNLILNRSDTALSVVDQGYTLTQHILRENKTQGAIIYLFRIMAR
ncbi:Hypothetical protein ETEE_3936 [Edwardsiella anguillarum ET080813]|uniref:Uncharacterized protein n=1 Tax=Edwardsiella anguillarum ET080813 TaxID=667120 RepID=A0A076LP24_9GAMM|nr:Hypothetical protein ETEE_3936 [Edwardsiella anguillarum ET080813]